MAVLIVHVVYDVLRSMGRRRYWLYHRDCIRAALDVGSARLARLRKTVQDQSSHPFVDMTREEVTHYSDVVLPKGCELPVSTWLQSQPEGAAVACRNTTRHSNAGKRSHNAKNEVILKRFLEFVDLNSSPNGRKEGSHGSTLFFNPKFTMLRTPDKKNAQYVYKCHHSVLFEFNRSLEEDGLTTISVGTFHSWLKQHRSYIGICPPQSDYCDKCEEYHKDISRARQIANRYSSTDSTKQQKRKCTYPGCSGSGHVNPGRKRHLSENNCPLAAKKPRS